MPGPAKAPAKVLQLKGRGPGKDIAGRPIPVPPKFNREAPEPPEWLSEEARAEWDRVVPSLEELDLLKATDRAMLVAYCETWDLYMTAVLKVRAEGMTITNPETGFERKHPVLAVVMETAAQLRQFAREFGLSPAAENGIGKTATPNGDEADPFAGNQASG